jgi:hypothetical protein
MPKRLIVAFLLLTAAFSAKAKEYTDVYLDVAEPGWGAFLVQSDTFQFISFFIYGPDAAPDGKNKPTWYTAQLTDDGTGTDTFTGPLYAITGTYFANPWQGYNITPAGTATFQAIDNYHATLKYTVNGLPAVTKAVVRQTLTPYQLAGNFSGSMAGNINSCADPSANDPALRARYSLVVAPGGDATEATTRTATLTFTLVDQVHNGLVCTVTGPLTHFGRLYQMGGTTTMACTGLGTDGVPRPAAIDSFHLTGQGIEGKLTGNFGGGCMGSLHFATVFNQNQ